MPFSDTAVEHAKIQWDKNGQPISSEFGDVYFSKEDGLAESEHVFLNGNHLQTRWSSPLKRFTIAETGFGTGLNFLLAWQMWRDLKQTGQLHFVSVEKFPLNKHDLKQALSLWPSLAPMSAELISAYPPRSSERVHRRSFDESRVHLTLIFDDAVSGLSELNPMRDTGPLTRDIKASFGGPVSSVDAWFLDGFAPAQNPEMWSAPLFETMAQLSHNKTSFATFTVAGVVRRGLARAGFAWKKLPGFGSKREMLQGEFSPEEAHAQYSASPLSQPESEPSLETVHEVAPWALQPAIGLPRHTIIIGAGIAGCHTARALANKGCKVTLIEANTIASGGSGNPQGAVYAKISPHHNALNQFNRLALGYANQFYAEMGIFENSGNRCGVTYLATDEKTAALYREFSETCADKSFVEWLEAEDLSKKVGVPLHNGGVFVPGSGWLNPRLLCEHLLDHPAITIKENTKVTDLKASESHTYWTIETRCADAHSNETTDCVVLACAHSAISVAYCDFVKLGRIRGQITALSSDGALASLKSVVCGDGYIAPAYDGSHTLGASFNLGDASQDLSHTDHQENLSRLTGLLNIPDFSETSNSMPLSGRVGFRCTSPDYLPIVGPIPNCPHMDDAFASLRKDAKTKVDALGSYQRGLYANLAHGSRGLCYTPLAAELLASAIWGDPLPIDQALYRFLHPARFVLRDLSRNRR